MSTETAVPQFEEARARANFIRNGRAALKRQIFAGKVDLAEILDPDAEIPECLQSAAMIQALMAQRSWGRHRARRVLNEVGIGERRRLDGLTPRERGRVVAAIRRNQPEHREVPAAA